MLIATVQYKAQKEQDNSLCEFIKKCAIKIFLLGEL